FFHILAVIPFRPGQAEQTLLQDRILTIPHCQRKAETTFAVSEAQQTIFTPAVGSASSMIMRKVIPTIAICGVVLAYRCPLALRKVRSPAFPVHLAFSVGCKTLFLAAAFHTSALHSIFIKFQPRYESDTELHNRAILGGFQSVLLASSEDCRRTGRD